MTNECIPYYEGPYAQTLTVHAAYALVGKTFAGPLTTYQTDGPGLASDPLAVNNGGNLICAAAPTAGGAVSGVAMWDVAILGKAVIIRGTGVFLPVTSGAAITAGALLKVTTAGKVITATTGAVVVGLAHSTVGATDLDVVVELFSLNPATLSA